MAERDSKVKIDLGYDIAQHKVNFGIELTNLSFMRQRNPLSDAWRRERIISQAKKDAKRNIPDSSATSESTETELDILSRREAGFQHAKDAILRWREKVNAFVLQFRPNPITAHGVTAAVQGQLERLKTSYLELYENDREYAESYARVEKFKRRNGIDRDGRIPDLREKVFGVILSVMFVETIFNGLLFQNISEQGFAGGWFLALVLSALNISFGIFTGFVLFRRWVFPGYVFKALAVVCCVLLLGFNFFVAHFRYLAEVQLSENRLSSTGSVVVNPVEVYHQIAMSPFAFVKSFDSLALLALGVTISIFTIIEGIFYVSDPFPGYGRVWRDYQDRKKHRLNHLKKYKLQAHDFIDAVLRDVQLAEILTRHFEQQVEGAISSFDLLKERADTWLNNVNTATEAHMAAYRNANNRERNRLLKIQEQRSRKGKPVDFRYTSAPLYFHKRVVLPVLAFDNLSQTTEDWGGALQAIKSNLVELARVPAALEDLRGQIDTNIQKSLESAKISERRVMEQLSTIESKPLWIFD
ncbi:MAG: hypothetical protein ACXU8U_01060 [Asticcacaulis sp.]